MANASQISCLPCHGFWQFGATRIADRNDASRRTGIAQLEFNTDALVLRVASLLVSTDAVFAAA